MRSQVKLLVLTLVIGPAVLWGSRVPGAVAGMESFRIRSVEVRGVRVLTEDSVVAWMQLGPSTSVWGDRSAWEERLAAHPMIRSAEVRRRLPHGLRVVVEERQAVALAATPTLEAVDAEGHRLPIDPTRYRLDLPVISATRMPPQGATLFPEDVRLLAAEVEHLTQVNGEFMQRVSTVAWLSDRALIVHLISPDVDFILPVHVPGDRLREGEAALSHALAIDPGDVPQVVDLRFAEQVVVRRRRGRAGATAFFTAGGR